MAEKVKKYVPEYRGQLRDHCIEIPRCITQASGIRIFGRRIKSLVFTTDIAIIRNINADAVIAVYPFTPQPAITHAILTGADMPVFSGVGGGITSGARVVSLAMDAEALGATGVVVNAPTSNDSIRRLKEVIDIPVVVTVARMDTDIAGSRYIKCIVSAEHAGAGRPNSKRFSQSPDYCNRRTDGGEHPPNHCGGCQCDYLYSANLRRTV